MKSQLLAAFISVVVTGLVVGCAKDRTTDDYRSDQATREFIRLSGYTGDYVGEVQPPSDTGGKSSDSIGFAIHLEPDTTIGSSPNLPTNELRSSLKGNAIVVLDGQQKNLPFSNAYPSTTGVFNASVPFVTLTQTTSLSISGSIQNDLITGTIEIDGLSSAFSVRRIVSGTVTDALTAKKGGSLKKILSRRYTSSVQLADKKEHDVSMIIRSPRLNASQEFYDVFAPTKTVEVVIALLTASKSAELSNVTFPSANWDIRNGNGSITAKNGLAPGGYAAQSVACNPATVDGSQGWDCAYSSGPVDFTAKFKPVAQ